MKFMLVNDVAPGSNVAYIHKGKQPSTLYWLKNILAKF